MPAIALEDHVYETGFATRLIDDKGGCKELLAWSPKIDIAHAQFHEACRIFPDGNISTRQRGREVLHRSEAGEYWPPDAAHRVRP